MADVGDPLPPASLFGRISSSMATNNGLDESSFRNGLVNLGLTPEQADAISRPFRGTGEGSTQEVQQNAQNALNDLSREQQHKVLNLVQANKVT